MNFLQSIFLGILQGIAEFFPISSSGHMILFQTLFGTNSLHDRLFDAVVQIGSLIALCRYFYMHQNTIFVSNPIESKNNLFVSLLISSFPVSIIGFLFHRYIKEYFYSLFVVSWMWIIGSLIFIFAEKQGEEKKRSLDSTAFIHIASIIGLFQVGALIPGISRSGITIAGALLLGLSRKEAIHFSFFIAIPILSLAAIYDLTRTIIENGMVHIHWIELGVGIVSASIVSIYMIEPAIRLLMRFGLIPFALYRMILGFISLIYQYYAGH